MTSYKKTLINITKIKNFFQNQLENNLNLTTIVGPLLLDKKSKLNDYLVQDQNAVVFYAKGLNEDVEIVQSLAKWKRFVLDKYEFKLNEGIVVDMKAIRPHEIPDWSHSLFVDQWDWELIISNKDRNKNFLKNIVNKIYFSICETQKYIKEFDKSLSINLPNEIKFFESQELEDLYPNIDFDEVVELVAKEYKAIFIIGIGKKLKSGRVFDLRSHEYDDWDLNGDLILWSEKINHSIEISSMGIRVNSESLLKQANITKEEINHSLYYKKIINNQICQTIGGGIGQSRLFMFLLEKTHLSEVQPSVWDENQLEQLIKNKKEIL